MARPRIADYPFTTLEPVLGVVAVGEEEGDEGGFVLADLPGLIEGAHAGKGLGLQFLKHVERTKLLLHLLDLAAGDPSPLEAYEMINRELESYDQALAGKPRVVAGNKTDLAEPGRVEEIREAMAERGVDFFPISALTGEGLGDLLEALSGMLRESREAAGAGVEPEPSQERTVYKFRPKSGKGFEVTRDQDGFRVSGEGVEKLVARTDLDSHEALAYLQKRLRTMGVEEELGKQGAQEGTPSSSGTWSSTSTPTERTFLMKTCPSCGRTFGKHVR